MKKSFITCQIQASSKTVVIIITNFLNLSAKKIYDADMRRTCAFMQSCQSLSCLFTQSSVVDEDSV